MATPSAFASASASALNFASPEEVLAFKLLYLSTEDTKNFFDIDINATNKEGQTALIIASIVGRAKIVGMLIGANVDVNIKDNYGFTALIEASRHEQWEIVEMLLEDGVCDVNARENRGRTALMHAASKEIVRMLILHNANINAKDYEGNTALMLACEKEDVSIIVELIDSGADVNSTNFFGRTALSKVKAKYGAIIHHLILAGAK